MRIPRPSHSSCSKREPVGRFHAKSARWPEPQRLLCPERPAAPDWAASCSVLQHPRLSHRGVVPGDPLEVPAFTRQALGLQMDTPGPCGASRPPDLRRRRMAPTLFLFAACMPVFQGRKRTPRGAATCCRIRPRGRCRRRPKAA